MKLFGNAGRVNMHPKPGKLLNLSFVTTSLALVLRSFDIFLINCHDMISAMETSDQMSPLTN